MKTMRRVEKDELTNEVEAEKHTRAAREEEKTGLTTEIRELQAGIDTRMRSWREK